MAPMSPTCQVLQSGLSWTSAQMARLRLAKPKVSLWFSCLKDDYREFPSRSTLGYGGAIRTDDHKAIGKIKWFYDMYQKHHMLACDSMLLHSSRDSGDKPLKETWHFSSLMLVSKPILAPVLLSAHHHPDFRASIVFLLLLTWRLVYQIATDSSINKISN